MKANFALAGKLALLLTPLHKIRHSATISAFKSGLRRTTKKCRTTNIEKDGSDAADKDSSSEKQRSEASQSQTGGYAVDSAQSLIPETEPDEGDAPVMSLDDLPDVSNPEVDILHYNFTMSKMQFEDAQQMFLARETKFDQELQERAERLNSGEEVETITELDMRQLQESRRLTSWLIEAEKKYDNAKLALCEAGVQPLGSNIASGFIDDVDDGYRISEEKAWIVTANSSRLRQWLSNIPDQIEDSETAEDLRERDLDPWTAEEVEICDSWSMVADGAERRRIDRWRSLVDAMAVGQGSQVDE
ncbi:uncharacterized protein MYCFIDRAFT_176650 [Pseudocercospora fijiensis CIRAD86]|uniref:Uncharacterized protein n=1 Tax=Pseudocercospora fijiensis (strain CIRAD86) TaxID=383855 RepID=M2ZQL2_PSEFD|nr:uncharacterized protein MYCFIDRAFT_176650 [Pseudocercospora fijiensis CIRAD86]EME81369.1 hypothetical protein MYCFIDRAFT_176650 [Pseudocercospora fijiensis CIRAD86]